MRILVVYHKADLDGRCSAAIVGRFYHWKVEYIGSDYELEPPLEEISKLRSGDKLFLLDFSFAPKVMESIYLASQVRGFDFIYIDHHKTAIEQFSKLDGLQKVGVAACELTHSYLYPTSTIPLTVRLLSDYDTWKEEKSNWRSEILPFQYGVQVFKTEPNETILWSSLLDLEKGSGLWKLILNRGDAILRYLEKEWKSNREQCCGMFLDGIPCKVQTGGSGSMVFGDLVEENICVTLELCKGGMWKVHLYSQKYDVSEIAKAHGGGGHKSAAGFVCKDPFKYLRQKPSCLDRLRKVLRERCG